MAIRITNLNTHSTPTENIYLFDTNIWLLVLGLEPNPDARQTKYIGYFQKVVKTKSVIILPALLVSEVIHRLIYKEMSAYAKKKGEIADKTYLKQVYRYTPEFKIRLQTIYDDFGIHSASCTLVNDNFGNAGFKQKDLFTISGAIIEFNDNYLFKIAQHNNAVIVTNDSDFLLEGIDVFTYNTQLIERSRK